MEKKIKVNDLRNLSGAEMDERIANHEKELFDLRQKKLTGQLDKPHFFKQTRRQIARLLTLKKEAILAEKKS